MRREVQLLRMRYTTLKALKASLGPMGTRQHQLRWYVLELGLFLSRLGLWDAAANMPSPALSRPLGSSYLRGPNEGGGTLRCSDEKVCQTLGSTPPRTFPPAGEAF